LTRGRVLAYTGRPTCVGNREEHRDEHSHHHHHHHRGDGRPEGSGHKLALQAGVLIFGLASLGALVVDTAGQLIALRAAMGVGGALIMPATLSIIANVFTGEERGKAIGIWAALAAVGIGLGPLAGGLLLEWFAWWSVFMLNVPFAAIALLLGARYVPESRDPQPGSFDLPGAALSTAGFTALVYALIEAPDDGWLSGLVLGAGRRGCARHALLVVGAAGRGPDARSRLLRRRTLPSR
jgi:MFS family permease